MSSLGFAYEAEESFMSSFFMASSVDEDQEDKKRFLQYIWEQFLILIEKEKGKRVSNNWFRCLELTHWNAQKKIVSLYAPNSFIKSWLENNFISLIEKVFARLFHEEKIYVVFSTARETEHTVLAGKASEIRKEKGYYFPPSPYAQITQDFLELDINPHFTMDQFLILQSNETVISAIQYFVEKANQFNNILFIHGKINVGKTHLLQAMREIFLKKEISCVYIHAETFLKEYINAAKTKKIDAFETLFVGAKILMFDNIEILENKKYTQEFLLKLFNHSGIKQKKIIITSKFLPKEMHGLSAVMAEKLEAGLLFKFGELTSQEIKEVLFSKAKYYHYSIKDTFIEYISSLPGMNISQYENILHRVMTESIIKKKEITLELLKESLNQLKNLDADQFSISLKSIEENKLLKIDDLLLHLKRYFNIKDFEQIKNIRTKETMKIKYVAIYLMKYTLKWSSVAISKFFGYKDHTTIGYALKKFDQFYKNEEKMKKVLSFEIKKK